MLPFSLLLSLRNGSPIATDDSSGNVEDAGSLLKREAQKPVSYTHLTLPTTPYV